MPAFGLLALLGLVGFALASGGKKPAPGEVPGGAPVPGPSPVPGGAPIPGPSPVPGGAAPPPMPEDLKDKFAAALRILTVDPVTGQVIGPVTAAAVQAATATAGELERAGFTDAANTIRSFASIAAQMVAAPPPASQIQIPGIPPDLQAKLNTALQMERDPAKLKAIKVALLTLQPQGPEVVAAEGMLDALILQIETANATNTALQQVQATIDLPKPATFAPGVFTGTHQTIRLGSKGTDVATWQRFLGLTADGVFGPQTDAATKKFQAQKGLKADGIVGPQTWAAAQGGLAPAPGAPAFTPVVMPATPIVFAPGNLAGPHPTIRLGSKGPDVSIWQKFLGVPQDGSFGPQTDAATRAFQKSRNLTADGIVGPATWAAALGGAPSVVVPGTMMPTPAVFTPGAPAPSGAHGTIRMGSKGPDVVAWQSFLGLKADGIFGSGTDAATRAFQKSHGLTADGVVGPATWAAASGGAPGMPAVVTPVVFAPTPTVSSAHGTIKLGSKGPDVVAWQQFLGVTADGIFGSGTDAATRKFQASRGLKPDGVVGPQTWGIATGGASTPSPTMPMTPTPAVFTPGSLTGSHTTIRSGSKGADVATWQRFLGLPADGSFGPQTDAATRKFQASRGLTADGVVGPATWAAASGASPGVPSVMPMTPTPAVFTPGSLTGSHTTIRSGSKGADVATWQRFLGLPADGSFGPQTDAATRKFQASRGLTADGVVGPASWAAAAGGAPAAPAAMPAMPSVMPIPSASPYPPAPIYTSTGPSAPAPTAHTTIRQGSHGPDVVAWQKVLGVTADGAFGPATAAATKTWQSRHGLSADGVVGPATWAAASASGAVISGLFSSVQAQVQAQAHNPTLHMGSRGREVAIWQHFLGLKQDGIFGQATRLATAKFQQRYGIAPDGVVGPHTWDVALRLSKIIRMPAHTVLRGETKESLAQHYTGNKDRWRELLTTNPNLADVNQGIRLEEGHAIRLPSEWVRGPVGSAPEAPLAESVPAPAVPVQPVDTPPVPQALPRPKTPLEIAASTTVKNLRAVQAQHGMPGAQRHEDRAFVARLQRLAGMSRPDGLAGPGTILTCARAGECTLPVVMYWPEGATAENVHQFRRVLQALAQKARSQGRHHQATELEASAAREHGQAGIMGSMVA